jgi:chromate reductase, NAD(P)H dehydrogenase (quinone)
MGEIRILGIVGSQRRESSNRRALLTAQELLPIGVGMELLELHGIPYFEARRETQPPPAVVAFRRRVETADAVIFATPECNHALPGGLRSAIAWVSGPAGGSVWLGKPAAVISANAGNLVRSRAQARLKLLLGELKMLAVDHPGALPGNDERAFGGTWPLAQAPARQFLRELLVALVGQVLSQWAASSFNFKERA